MAKINTLNYQTVASWNGSQDLFVVEQPDGTKVATPAMVKQFMESGNFTATGEITDGHGNILKDMAKSADVDAEIGDLSQTGLTGDSVAEQLGSAKTYVDNAVSYIAGDVIADENVVVAAVGSNANDCYFSIPLSKPVVASSVSISNVNCSVYYGTNQKETVSGGTYTGTIEKGSILIKMTKTNTFSQNGRYVVDFTGTFTFS